MAPSVFIAPFVAQPAVEPVGGVLHVGAGRLEPHGVRDDELVGVALLLAQRAAALLSVDRVGDGAVEGLPAAAEAERGDHEPGVAEDLLGLDQALARREPDEVVGGHLDVVEEERGGVGQPDAVLVLWGAG